jgi:hypothetical protein
VHPCLFPPRSRHYLADNQQLMLALGRHACQRISRPSNLHLSASRLSSKYSTRGTGSEKPDPRTVPQDKWNYNRSSLYDPTPKDISRFKWITGQELEKGVIPPRRVKMLVRDFIEDSLYNPTYGYFSKNATIFGTKNEPFNFNSLRDSAEFTSEVGKHYAEYKHNAQLWHTPTELFRVSSSSFNFY